MTTISDLAQPTVTFEVGSTVELPADPVATMGTKVQADDEKNGIKAPAARPDLVAAPVLNAQLSDNALVPRKD